MEKNCKKRANGRAPRRKETQATGRHRIADRPKWAPHPTSPTASAGDMFKPLSSPPLGV